MDIREVVLSLRTRIAELERTIEILETEFGRQSPTSQWEYLHQTLEEAEQPLQVAELLARMQAAGWKTTSKNPKALLYVSIRDWARKGQLVKMARGRWGLPEWEKAAKRKLAQLPLSTS